MNPAVVHNGSARARVLSLEPRLGQRSRISTRSPTRLTGASATIQPAAIFSSWWHSNASIERVAGSRGGKLVVQGLASDETDADVPLEDRIQPGSVVRLYSPDELDQALEMLKGKVVVVQCKAKTCRPCMAFAKKYIRLADAYPDIVFFELYGDQNKESRKLMMTFGVKATPTFRVYSDGELQDTVVGINEKKVTKAVLTPAGLWVEEEEEEPGQLGIKSPETTAVAQNESKKNELVEK